jgi:methylated-DNA-protein-cysteine methyltransferase-like protein
VEIGIKDDEGLHVQKMNLQSEGIAFIGERTINLKLYQYNPIIDIDDTNLI